MFYIIGEKHIANNGRIRIKMVLDRFFDYDLLNGMVSITRITVSSVTTVAVITAKTTTVTSTNNNINKTQLLNTFLYHRQVLDAWRRCPTQEPMMRSSPTTTEVIKLGSYYRINKCLFIDL